MDPLVRYKASQALKHPWITRLRTEIPLNLFESLRRVKIYEQIDSVIKVVLFSVLSSGAKKEIDEVYEETMNTSSKLIADWHSQQELASKSIFD